MTKYFLNFLIVGVVLTLSAVGGYAQNYRYNPMTNTGVPTIDITPEKSHAHTIIRNQKHAILYPSVVNVSPGGIRKDRLVMSYLFADDSAPKTVICTSRDGGATWSNPTNNTIDNADKRPISMFSVATTSTTSQPNNAVLFVGKTPLQAIISMDEGETWSNMSGINNLGGFKVTSCVKLRDGRTMALFHDDGRFINGAAYPEKSVIYKIYSYDGGFTWSKPEIALKHNVYGLYDACAVRITKGSEDYIAMIVSERREKTSLISISSDDGSTWSYPMTMPTFMHGDRFCITPASGRIMVVYRDMYGCTNPAVENNTFGDLVLWIGNISSLRGGGRDGYKVRIADNFPLQDKDRSDLRTSDCGYPSIISTGKNKYAIVAYGRWDTDSPPFIKRFDIDVAALDKFYKNNKK